MAVINGTTGGDTLPGTAADDIISGLGGNDKITGLAGDDQITGGTGNDILDGGEDNDTYLVGMGDGFDTYGDGGSTGTDSILATADNVAIGLQSGFSAASGIEAISANGFAGVTIKAGSGHDTLNFSGVTLTGITAIDGGVGSDVITGSGAADTIIGGIGNDTMNGGEGGDTYLIGAGAGVDTFKDSGISGTDKILFTADNAVLGLALFGPSSGIEAISADGHAGAKIVGTAAANSLNFSATTLTGITAIDAGGGNDTIVGSAAADAIQGGTGTDKVTGGAGNDNLDGGEDGDTYLVGAGDGIDTYSDSGTTGTDSIRATANNVAIGLQSGFGPSSGIEAISANGFSGVTIKAGTGNDSLNFSGVTLTGITAIDGGNGSDSITGSAAADTIIGGAGNDTMNGGEDGDTYLIGTGAGVDTFKDSGASGADKILFTADNAVLGLALFGPSSGIEAISADGHTGGKIVGTAAANSLNFSATALTGITAIDGGGGNDTIVGSAAADTILGGAGDDKITGGAGVDTLTGGADKDTFVFNLGDTGATAGTRDLVTDFTSGTDHLDTSKFGKLNFIGTADFSGGGKELHTVYDSVHDVTIVEGDVNGDKVADFGIELSGKVTLTEADFTPPSVITALQDPPGDLGKLDGSNGFLVTGGAATQAGRYLGNAGDVNGDGFDDVIVGMYRGMQNAPIHGAAIVFGGPHGFPAKVDSSTLDGSNGFQVVGMGPTGNGGSVIATGDFNGDGISDIVLGDPFGYSSGGRTGSAYLIYGKESGWNGTIDVSTLDGTNGFKLNGISDYDHAAQSVSVGDVNGDGFDDLIVGASRIHINPAADGTTYILFGHAGGSAAELSLSAASGAGGFSIAGPGSSYGRDYFGYSTTTADINGDGFNDMVIGAFAGNAAAVVFGHGGAFTNLDAANLDGATTGFLVTGANGYNVGLEVAGLGDINGDGYDDLLFSYGASGGSISGAVVFGHGGSFADTIDLGALDGQNGFLLTGADTPPWNTVSAAGDVNGDGYADIIIGDFLADTKNGGRTGEAFVLFGSAAGFASTVDLANLQPDEGFKIPGAKTNDFAANAVTAAGDVNGDGYDDLLIGASSLKSNAGGAYVVYGGNFSDAVTHQGTIAADTMTGTAGADVMIGGKGADTINGGGGADAIRGGAGDDQIHVTDGSFRAIVGGGGEDTLHLDFGGAIDFGNIDGNAATSDRGKISGIEAIDVDNGQSNAMTLHLADVLDLDLQSTDTGGKASLDNVLKIEGNAGDTLHLAASEGWGAADTSTLAGYAIYTVQHVQVAVDTQIVVTVS